MQPSHDKSVVAVEESVERSKLFRRPSASDLEVLRCNLADKFEALATEETCDSGPVKASRRELQELARPLAGSKTDSMLVAAELVGASAEPSVVSYKDSTLQPPQKDPALEPGTCLLSKRNSTPDLSLASQKDSITAAKNPEVALVATSSPEPSQKDPSQEPSDRDAAGSAGDIPDVPLTFTRVQQRNLRKQKVAAQRKRKHGECEDAEDESEKDGEASQPAEPRGRGRGGRGRGRGRDERQKDEEPSQPAKPRGRGRGGRGRGRDEDERENAEPSQPAEPRGRGRGGRGRGGALIKDDEVVRARSRSPVVMKRPAAKAGVAKKAVEPQNKSKAVSAVPAASEAEEADSGALMQEKLKAVLEGLPRLRAETADVVRSHADFNSRDILPIPNERRGPLKATTGCTELLHV